MNQIDITDIYGSFHPKTKDYNFSLTYSTFSEIDHIIGLKASLNRYKKIDIILGILSDHHGLRLDFNNRNKVMPTSWKLNNSLVNDHLVREEIEQGSKDLLECWEQAHLGMVLRQT